MTPEQRLDELDRERVVSVDSEHREILLKLIREAEEEARLEARKIVDSPIGEKRLDEIRSTLRDWYSGTIPVNYKDARDLLRAYDHLNSLVANMMHDTGAYRQGVIDGMLEAANVIDDFVKLQFQPFKQKHNTDTNRVEVVIRELAQRKRQAF